MTSSGCSRSIAVAALREHLDDEEEHVLPLIAERLTVAEWARLGERFAAETRKDKLLFFLGLILEDASPAERDAMLGNLPAPAGVLWHTVGQRQIRRIRAGLPPVSEGTGRRDG